MAWVRIDDAMPRHPKFVEAGPLAGWLFVSALCYANQYTTDGFISETVIPVLTSIPDVDAEVQRLIRARLFERVDGGYLIHDYLEFQPSADKIKSSREQARDRMSRTRSQEVLKKFARTSDEVREKFTDPNPTQPNPTPTRRGKRLSQQKEVDERFETFWSSYPVKKAKANARAAWDRREFSDEDVTLLMSALNRQRESWTDPRYIPHAATWLNQERWNDEVVVGPPGKSGGNPFVFMLEEEYRESSRDNQTARDRAGEIPENGVW